MKAHVVRLKRKRGNAPEGYQFTVTVSHSSNPSVNDVQKALVESGLIMRGSSISRGDYEVL